MIYRFGIVLFLIFAGIPARGNPTPTPTPIPQTLLDAKWVSVGPSEDYTSPSTGVLSPAADAVLMHNPPVSAESLQFDRSALGLLSPVLYGKESSFLGTETWAAVDYPNTYSGLSVQGLFDGSGIGPQAVVRTALESFVALRSNPSVLTLGGALSLIGTQGEAFVRGGGTYGDEIFLMGATSFATTNYSLPLATSAADWRDVKWFTHRLVASKGVAQTGSINGDTRGLITSALGSTSVRQLVGMQSRFTSDAPKPPNPEDIASNFAMFASSFSWSRFSFTNIGKLRTVVARTLTQPGAVGSVVLSAGILAESPLINTQSGGEARLLALSLNRLHHVGLLLEPAHVYKVKKNLLGTTLASPEPDPRSQSLIPVSQSDDFDHSSLISLGSVVLGNGTGNVNSGGYVTDVTHVDGFVRLPFLDGASTSPPSPTPLPPRGSVYLRKTPSWGLFFFDGQERQIKLELDSGSSYEIQVALADPRVSESLVYVKKVGAVPYIVFQNPFGSVLLLKYMGTSEGDAKAAASHSVFFTEEVEIPNGSSLVDVAVGQAQLTQKGVASDSSSPPFLISITPCDRDSTGTLVPLGTSFYLEVRP